jgi:hypothetical protein
VSEELKLKHSSDGLSYTLKATTASCNDREQISGKADKLLTGYALATVLHLLSADLIFDSLN